MGAISVEMRECAADSTMHALPKVVKRNPGFIRVLWLVMCLLATVLMVLHFLVLLDRFMHTPVTTSFSVNASSRALPTITLCVYSLSVPSLEALIAHKENITGRHLNKKTIFSMLRKYTAEGGRNKVNVRATPDKFILGCSINEMDCTSSSSWRLVGDVSKYRCFRLDASVDLNYQNPTKVDLYVYSESAKDTNDFRGKLDEILDHDTAVYLHTYSIPNTCIQPSAGLPIQSGCMQEIYLRSNKLIQKPLPVPDMDVLKCNTEQPTLVHFCNEANNLDKESPHRCSEDARLCFANRIQEVALRECNETSRYHEQNFLVGCPLGLGDRKITRTKPANDSQCVTNVLQNQHLINRIALQCTPCDELKWKNSVRYANWPKEEVTDFIKMPGPANVAAFQQRLRKTMEKELGIVPKEHTHRIFTVSENMPYEDLKRFYQRHIAYIRFEIDLDVDVMQEQLAYPFSSFMGEVGGIMGLWLGCSVITFLEPLEILLRVLVNLSKRKQVATRSKDAKLS